jgi:hypothetical protein
MSAVVCAARAIRLWYSTPTASTKPRASAALMTKLTFCGISPVICWHRHQIDPKFTWDLARHRTFAGTRLLGAHQIARIAEPPVGAQQHGAGLQAGGELLGRFAADPDHDSATADQVILSGLQFSHHRAPALASPLPQPTGNSSEKS